MQNTLKSYEYMEWYFLDIYPSGTEAGIFREAIPEIRPNIRYQ